MALRNIRTDEDPVLRKKSRRIEKFDKKLHMLLEDMAETMYEAPGVGLAAPQVGILRRVLVYDNGIGIMEIINPEILEKHGEQHEVEGCLSVPGIYGKVKRPAIIKYKYMDRYGEEHTAQAQDMEAVILCHETDHLEGILFTDHDVEYLTEEDLEELAKSKDLEESEDLKALEDSENLEESENLETLVELENSREPEDLETLEEPENLKALEESGNIDEEKV